MTIIQSPATYNFAGNIPDLIVDTTEQLSFTLSRGGTQIVAETYTPAQNDRIVINLRNLLELLVEVPGYEEVATPIAQYTYTLGSTTGTFYCLPGGHGAAVSAESFLRGNFLTWQPQTRVTLYHTPHRLRYAALAACVCKVKGYFTDGTSAVISLLTMSAGNIYTMDVSFGTIRGKFDTQPTYYDVWVENTTGQAMTWGQRYMLADFEAGTNDYFIFANSLGGFDTIRFSGDRKEINKLESVNAIFDDQTLEYDIDRTRSWKKYTGYIADEQLRMWVLDFFNSPQRYHLTDSGALQRIYVSEPKLEDTAGETAGYEFTYAYSRQSRYINLERAETPQLLEITDPASEVFFLAPRLNQFEAADPASSADYLIPIQAAAADKWLAISLASLLDYIKPTGIDVDALQDYLTDHKYATQAWVSQQNFLTTAALDNYLLKSVWDEVFEITTENGVRVLNVKLDIVGLKGISAYGLGSTSGGSASGSLGELVNVGQWADAVPTADRVMVQLAGATHWSAKPLADLVGLDTAALAQYLTANSYLKASDISSYLTWANLSGKPTVYPTSWELVVGRPTKLSDLTDDVVAGNYLPKSTWDAVFEVVTVDGTPALKVKYDILGLKGISAYGLGSTSGGSASGSLGELVNVGQWADAVPTADRVMVQLAGATHWSAKPLADLVGLDTAALAQYLTANSYLKASDISSYLTWANLSGKPTVYPTSWELVTGRPTKLSDLTDDVVAGNYLPKPTWDAVFEVVTVDGTPALKVKYDILGLKGITAYADGSLSGGFSGALVDLVDVAVTNLASGDILKYNGTHFVNVPVSSIAGASSWDQITGKPEYYPTRWADVSGAPTSLPASDVYPWAKAASKPTYTAAEVGALALSGGTLTGNVITIGSFILANSGAYPQLTFRATADNSERLLFRHGNDLKWRYNGTNDGIIYHSGNFNPDSKLGVSSVAVEAKKMSYQGLMTAISGTTTFPAGLYLYGVYNNGYPITYGNLLRVGGMGLGEMLFGWAGDASVGGLYYRSKRDVAATAWSNWCKLWTSANSNLSTIDWSANNLNAAANLDVAGQAYVSGWLRSRGNVGWYSQDYGGGIHMTDSTWVRVYGSKGLMIDTGTSPINMGQLQITCSAEASIGFRSASNGNWCLGKGVSSIGSGFGLYNAATNRVAFQIASATDNASFVGSITAPTFVGNLSGSASSVNGYDINSFTGYYKYTIDASSLDQNTYYPVTMYLGNHNTVRISVIVALDSGTKPAWSSHASGYSVRFIEEVNGSGWGTSEVSRNILANEYRFANANPVGRVEQMTNSSTEVIWVRGGGKYFFYLSIPYITPALRTSTFTNASQSVSPRTDTMDLRMAANGNGIAVSKLYAHNSIEINGFTIDVYNGALRVNGNLVATGGVTAYQ